MPKWNRSPHTGCLHSAGFRSWLQTSCIPLWRPLRPAGIPKLQAPKPDQSPTASCSCQEGCSAAQCGISGNEQADILAKESARGEQHANNVSFSEKKTLIRALTMPKLQGDDYHLLSRKQQVILVRLRTGHNRLNSHMHRKLKLAPSPTCPCGQEEQTTEHVLQRCPLYKATREDVWPLSTSLTTKLYGCKQELEKMISFISRAALIR